MSSHARTKLRFSLGKAMKTIKTEKVNLTVGDGTHVDAFLARPDDAIVQGGVIVLQEAFGVNKHIRDVCERLAREGYMVIAPELFHRQGEGVEVPYDSFDRSIMQSLTDEGMEADMRAAFDWLGAQNDIKNGAIATIGFCMGGRASFLANVTLPLRAAISFYGGRIAETLLDRTEHLSGPMLFFWGGLDKHITVEHRRAVPDALDRAHKAYTNVEFSEAGHGFFCDQRGSYHPVAAQQAWVIAREFLRINLQTAG